MSAGEDMAVATSISNYSVGQSGCHITTDTHSMSNCSPTPASSCTTIDAFPEDDSYNTLAVSIFNFIYINTWLLV